MFGRYQLRQDCVKPYRPWDEFGNLQCDRKPWEDFSWQVTWSGAPPKQSTLVAAWKIGCRSTAGSSQEGIVLFQKRNGDAGPMGQQWRWKGVDGIVISSDTESLGLEKNRDVFSSLLQWLQIDFLNIAQASLLPLLKNHPQFLPGYPTVLNNCSHRCKAIHGLFLFFSPEDFPSCQMPPCSAPARGHVAPLSWCYNVLKSPVSIGS